MGLCLSKTPRRGSIRKSKLNDTLLNEKIKLALANELEEQSKLAHPMTLDRILLKFSKLQDVSGYIKDVFVQLSKDGETLDFEGLQSALKSLKGSSSKEEVSDIFHFSDLEENVKINLKEFMVALTVGVCLDNVNFGTEKIQLSPSPRRASISSFFGHPREVYSTLKLVIAAYLIFDTKGEGVIHLSQVEKILEESGHKVGNSMLTTDRWKELDWDENGTIDLAEFINAFTAWVDIDNSWEEDYQ